MRRVSSALLAALLFTQVSTTPAPAYAAAPISASGATGWSIPQVTPDHVLAAKPKSTAKKKKKKTPAAPAPAPTVLVPVSTGPGPVPVTISPIKDPYVGERAVFVQASTNTPGLMCHLVVKYSTGDQAPVADVAQDAANLCTFHFNASDNAKIIGGAGISISVYAPSAPTTVLGTGTMPFTVKKS